MSSPDIQVVIVSGLSGAGKSQVIRVLEDLGFFCVDNLPPAFVLRFAELCRESGGKVQRVAMGIDIRGGAFFDQVEQALDELERSGLRPTVVFLEADDATLVRRFKETRRRHPLAPQEGRVLEAIADERQRLERLRQRADILIDTTDRTPSQLREEIIHRFARESSRSQLFITVTSFGFKHGLPLDADLVFDVRFLPNPHYDARMRPLTGLDAEVANYALGHVLGRAFLRRLRSMLQFLLPHYVAEGKQQLAIAIGCTGGRHRSVAVAERLAAALRAEGYTVLTEHRDIHRDDADGR